MKFIIERAKFAQKISSHFSQTRNEHNEDSIKAYRNVIESYFIANVCVIRITLKMIDNISWFDYLIKMIMKLDASE